MRFETLIQETECSVVDCNVGRNVAIRSLRVLFFTDKPESVPHHFTPSVPDAQKAETQDCAPKITLVNVSSETTRHVSLLIPGTSEQ